MKLRKFLLTKLTGMILAFVANLLLISNVQAQTTTISGVVNIYTQVTAIDTGCLANLTVNDTTGFRVGDTVLVIQMKGATVSTTNDSTFGTINSYGTAGNYEFNIILAVSQNDLALQNVLVKPYDPTGLVQVVRVPSYKNAAVNATLTAAAWNGTTGGVLAIEVADTLTINASSKIDVSGLGFVGGDSSLNSTSDAAFLGFVYPAGLSAGNKGEGIAQLPVGDEAGRGADANGGGGGNGNGGGGGGGGNYGLGGGGGGQNYLGYMDNGGMRGKNLNYSNSINTIFMGGGGGGGFQNNDAATPGANGAGIIIIRANTIVANNGASILANGNTSPASPANDGTGGGGAGGTVLLDVQSYSGNLTINTNGGNGSNNPNTGDGPGGGGGGGILWISGASALPGNVTYASTAGAHGQNDDPVNIGLRDGQPGGFLNGLHIVQSNFPTIFDVQYGTVKLGGCGGTGATSVALNQSPAQPGGSYSWSPAAGLSCTNCPSPIASPDTTTAYILIVTGSGPNAQCFAILTDSVIVSGGSSGNAGGGVIEAVRDTICEGTPGNLTLNNYSGTKFQWQSAGSANGSFSNVPDTTTGYKTAPLTQSTYYRVLVSSGACSAISDTLRLFVPPALIASFNNSGSGATISFNSDSSLGSIRSYAWNFGDGSTSTDSNPVHTYTRVDSTYYVCLTLYDGSNCSYTFCKYIGVDLGLGVNNVFAENKWTIYPNPVSDYILINNGEKSSIESVEIYDVLGRVVMNENFNGAQSVPLKLDASMLAEGMYYLKIQTQNESFIQPLVKQ